MLLARSLLAAMLLPACAYAPGGDPDAGRADARKRADGATIEAYDAAPASGVDAAPALIDGATSAVDSLVLSEIVDATLPGGLPKFVEVTNLGSQSVNLASYSLGIYSNGSATINGGSSHVLSGSLAAGASFVLSFENGDSPGSSTFFSVYGQDPDDFSFSPLINGNDTVVLFRGLATGTGADAITVDSYGQVGVDGTGTVWEYTDGFANRRQAASAPKPVFDANDWEFSMPNALDDATAPEIALATSPGTH